jgi:phage tail P2-like protein
MPGEIPAVSGVGVFCRPLGRNLVREEKRQAVSDAFWIHQRKGTVAAVRRVIENLGYSMTLQEWWEVADPPGHSALRLT